HTTAKLFLFPIILFLLISCGKTSNNSKSERLQTSMDALTTDDYLEELKNMERMGILVTPETKQEYEINKIIILAIKTHTCYKWLKENNIISSETNNHSQKIRNTGTVFEPLIYGPTSLSDSYQELIATIPTNLKDIENSKNLDCSQINWDANTHNFFSKLYETFKLAARWRTLIYHHQNHYFNKSKKDVRSYLIWQSKQNTENKEWQERLCWNHPQMNPTNCHIQFTKSKHFNSTDIFVKRYLPFAKKAYENLFTLKTTNPSAHLEKNDNNYVLHFYLNPNGFNQLFKLAKNAIETIWSFENLKLKIHSSTHYNAPTLSLTAGPISFVTKDRKKLFLSKDIDLNSHKAMQTMAHEFGHLLGFDDCYVEFLDPKLKSAVYYEVDRNNLMCNTYGVVNSTHGEELIHAYGNLN
ncbi:MAG: hypothetical protein ACOCUH_01700, partial [Bacteriovoracia bacterium]